MLNARRMLCTHLHTLDGFMKVRGVNSKGELVIDQIPTSEIFFHQPTYIVPIPDGFVPKDKKKKSVNEGMMLSVLIINDATAVFSPIISEPISTNEIFKFKTHEMWKGPKE